MTPALTATPEPTSEPTMAATPPPVPTEPAGARSNWPADVQAREKAVLFALAESPWPSHLWPEVLAVSYCESTWRPDAESTDGSNRGLLQLNAVHVPGWIARAGYTWDDMLSAGPNLTVAWLLYQDQGWQPWSCQP